MIGRIWRITFNIDKWADENLWNEVDGLHKVEEVVVAVDLKAWVWVENAPTIENNASINQNEFGDFKLNLQN